MSAFSEFSGGRVAVRARAKINLGLEVLGRRADGYHELRSVMWAIELADRVTLTVPTHPSDAPLLFSPASATSLNSVTVPLIMNGPNSPVLWSAGLALFSGPRGRHSGASAPKVPRPRFAAFLVEAGHGARCTPTPDQPVATRFIV